MGSSCVGWLFESYFRFVVNIVLSFRVVYTQVVVDSQIWDVRVLGTDFFTVVVIAFLGVCVQFRVMVDVRLVCFFLDYVGVFFCFFRCLGFFSFFFMFECEFLGTCIGVRRVGEVRGITVQFFRVSFLFFIEGYVFF